MTVNTQASHALAVAAVLVGALAAGVSAHADAVPPTEHTCLGGHNGPSWEVNNILVLPMAECDYGSAVNNAFHALNQALGNPQYMGVHCAFDADVTALVKEFQSLAALPGTGEIDAATWDALRIPIWTPVSGPDVNGNGFTDAAEMDGTSSNGCNGYTPDGCTLDATASSSHMSCTQGGHTVLTASCSTSASGHLTCRSSG